MSREIDERVVEMRFDNAQFEKNVQTSMSTLDKLKEKLKFKGASDGFENLSKSARNVDLNTLGNSAEKVGLKFNAMYTMADQAFRNITNSAMLAGKNIVKAFTIDPVKTGFNEYELKMGSIQTIMASTGESLETVNEYLNELNKYSDQTIYSFSDMTQNIGKFTNAGVKLEDAVAAIKGVANEAALSGANANEASRAMYNFAQALSAGYVKLIDWKSIENANMATVGFKEQLIETALEMGTLTKVTDGYKTSAGTTITATKNFNDSLQDQWMTSDVLITTLKKYTDLNTKIGQDATKAATEVKTFSQMMDSLKESAQSGWAQTWELIFGDFHEGKALWTSIYNVVGGFLDKMADARNKLLGGALGKGFSNLTDKISGMLTPAKKAVDTVKTASSALEDLGKIADRVIIGEFGNGKVRIEKLTKAGYSYAKVQNKVNEKLGSSVRHLEDAADAQEELVETQEDLNKSDGERIKALTERTDAELTELGYTKEQIEALRELQEEAEKTGLSIEDFVNNIDDLNGRWLLLKGFENIGTSIMTVFRSIGEAWRDAFPAMQSNQLYNLIAGFHKLTTFLVPTEETAGKLTRTFKGLFAILDIITTIVGGPIKIAFKIFSKILETFDLGILDVTAAIGDVLVKFRDWMDPVLDFTKVFENIKPTLDKCIEGINGWITNLKGTFSFIGSNLLQGLSNGFVDGAKGIWGAIVNFGKKILETIKGVLGIHSPSTETYEIGQNLISGLVNGIKDGVTGLFDIIKDVCASVLEKFDNISWYGIATGLNAVVAFIPKLKGLLTPLSALFSFGHAAGHDTMAGVLNGLLEGAKNVVSIIADIAQRIIASFCGVLGIHSPSTVMFAIGGFLIAGLIGGVLGSQGNLLDTLKELGSKCIDAIKNIDFGAVFAVALSVGIALAARSLFKLADRFADVAEAFAAPFKGLGKALSGIGTYFESLAALNKAKKLETTTKAILNIAIALGILAASIYALSKIDAGSLWKAIGALAALAAIIAALSFAASKIDVSGKEFNKLAIVLIGISVAMFIMASALKKLSFLNGDNAAYVLTGLVTIITGLTLILVAFGTFVRGKAAQNIDKAGVLILKISLVMLSLVTVIKMISKLDPGALAKGSVAIVLFGGIIVGLIAATKLGGRNMDKVGSMILKISIAMMLMVSVVKAISKMDPEAMAKGITGIVLFGGIVVGLVAATKLVGGKDLAKVGSTILAMSASIMLMVLTSKLLARMDLAAIVKGAFGIALFGGIVAGLVAATRFAGGSDLKRVSTTLFAMSLAIGILAAASMVLSLISIPGLIKGVIAISILGTVMALMVRSTKGAQDVKGSITAMAVAIGVMAASVAVLSFIDPSRLAGATLALSALMGMFALMTKATGTINKAMGTIIVMTIAIGLMTAAIWTLTEYTDPSEAIQAAGALSMAMVAMSAALKIISNIKIDAGSFAAIGALTVMCGLLIVFGMALSAVPIDIAGKEAAIFTIAAAMGAMSVLLAAVSATSKFLGNIGQMFTGILGLTVMCGLLVGFGWALSTIPDLTEKISTIIGVVQVMAAMSLLLLALTGIGALLATGVGAVAALAGAGGLIVMVGLLVGFAWVLSTVPDISDKFATITALTQLMILMTGLLTQLAIIGPFAAIGVAALGYLTGLMVAIGVLAAAVGALMEKFPALESFIDIGMPVLAKLANGIGAIIGNLVAGFAEGAMSGLPEIGATLSAFMTNAMPFIVGAKMIDPTVMEGVKTLAQIILLLTGANILDSLTSWFTGGTSLVDFGKQLAEFGPHMAAFAESVANINSEAVTAASNAGKALAEMADTIPSDWGNNNLTNFADQFVKYGEKIVDFSEAVSGKIDVDGINKAVKAGKKLTEMADTIPTDWNHNNLTNFGSQLVSFGDNLVAFSNSVAGNTGDISTAVGPIKELVAALSEISSESSDVLSSFTTSLENAGKNAVDSFINAFDNSASKAKKAVNKLVKEVVDKIKSGDNYEKFKAAGKYCVEGFAKGITDNTFIAEAKAKAMAAAAITAANEKLNVNSPSKVFMKTGGSVVEGFAKGITDNVGDATKASENMGKAVLEATQDYLGIHSPSIVFDKKVGRYIVQGIAEGIKKDMSAEEAAEKKAQNIVEAFRKKLDMYDLDSSIDEKELNLWLDQNENASTNVVDQKYLEFYNRELERARDKAKLAEDEWILTAKELGDGSKAEREAYDKYLTAQQEVEDAKDTVYEAERTSLTREQELIDRNRELRQANHETLEATWDDTTSEETKDLHNRAYLTAELTDLYKDLDIATKEYNNALEQYGRDSEVTHDALVRILSIEKDITTTRKDINQIDIDAKEREKQELEERRDLALRNVDIEYQIWEATLGRKAKDEEKELKKLESLEKRLNVQAKITKQAKQDWIDAKYKYGDNSNEALAEYNAYLNSELDLANLQDEILDINESIADRQQRVADKQKLARSEYEKYLKKYRKYYLENGMTIQELEKDAKLVSGYDPSKVVNTTLKKTNQGLNNLNSSSTYANNLSGFKTMGTSYVNAVNEGVEANADTITETLTTAFKQCFTELKNQCDIWVDIGKTIASSIADGIKEGTKEVIEAATKLGESTSNAVQSGVASSSYLQSISSNLLNKNNFTSFGIATKDNIAKAVGASGGSSVRPVVTASTTNAKAASINVNSSSLLASRIASGMSFSSANQNGSKASGGNTYSFTQNNYSPKALSSTEIYRRTNNQFTAMKGALKFK